MIFEVSTQKVPEGTPEEDAAPFFFLGFVEADDTQQGLERAKQTFGHIDRHPAVEAVQPKSIMQ